MTDFNRENKKKIPAILAPMAGFTDTVFRKIAADFGADACVSEMISAHALVMNDRKTAELAEIGEGEAPVLLQIFGHDPVIMARAAEILLDGSFAGCKYASRPVGIDINMGCPVKKIVSSGDGSALSGDIDLARRITSAVREVCEARGAVLGVKFRLGIDAQHINCVPFALALADAGADILTLHTRTRKQMYAPSAAPEYCREVQNALNAGGFSSVKLVGNGDIESYADAQRYIELGCDAVAVGRGALGNPWIFSQLADPDAFTPPSRDEIIALAVKFVSDVVALKGEAVGIRESRGRAAHFIKGMRSSARIRDLLNRAEGLDAFVEILQSDWES